MLLMAIPERLFLMVLPASAAIAVRGALLPFGAVFMKTLLGKIFNMKDDVRLTTIPSHWQNTLCILTL